MVRNQVELNSPKRRVQLIKRFCPMQIPLAGFILFYVAVLHLFYIKHNTLKLSPVLQHFNCGGYIHLSRNKMQKKKRKFFLK